MATSDRPRGEANRGRCEDRVLAPVPWCRWKQLLLMVLLQLLMIVSSLVHLLRSTLSGRHNTSNGPLEIPCEPLRHTRLVTRAEGASTHDGALLRVERS
eukprot:scaffold3982_cov65-Phaeocystis_antarctica.AAC.2